MAEKPLSAEEIKQFRLEKTRAAYKQDPRDPAQEMKDAGFTAFTAKGQRDLEIMKNRYTGDFKAFFVTLNNKYTESKRSTAEIRRISDVLSQINSLTIHIDKLLGSTNPKASIPDVKMLGDMVAKLDAEFVFFTNADNITKALSENIESVAQTTGISIEDLKLAQGSFGRKTKELTKPPNMLNQILPGMPELHRGIKRFGEGILASATLPFYPGIKSAQNIDKERAARKQTLEDREFSEAGINVSAENALPSFARPMTAGVGREGIISSRLSSREGSTSAYQSSGIQDDLFAFFNTKAYHAKWTKELLESAGRMPVDNLDKKDKGAGLLDMGVMASLARLIGPILGVLAAAQGGWMIGRWIGENVKIGGKSVDKHIEGFAQHTLFGGDESDQLKKIAKDKNLDPVVRRSAELMAADPKLNPVKASEMAQKEWAGRTRLDIGGKPDIETTNIERAKVGLPPIGTPESKSETLGAKAAPSEKTAMPENVWADPTSGMFVAIDPKTKQEFFGATAEEAAGERAKAQGIKSAAAAGLGVSAPASTGIKTTPKVPIDNTQAESDKEQKASIDKLDATITEMSDNLKESTKGKTPSKNSGYDANNTRNPVLSSIGAGQITS